MFYLHETAGNVLQNVRLLPEGIAKVLSLRHKLPVTTLDPYHIAALAYKNHFITADMVHIPEGLLLSIWSEVLTVCFLI